MDSGVDNPCPANPHPAGTPDYYLWELDQLDKSVRDGTLDGLDAQRTAAFWRQQAATHSIDIAEARRSTLEPIRQLLMDGRLVDRNEAELLALKNAIEEADGLGAKELTVKKKWVELIDLTLRLQAQARSNPIHFTIYVLRDQENDEVLTMEPIHVDFFKTWNDRKFLNSEILAPPGVGKTTCLYGQDLWDMAQDRSLRFVRISCDLPTARKRLGLLRMYVAGRRLRALYPDLHVDLARPDNSDEFTVIRPNIGSQDPTVVAKGARSEIQGAGLERICADDLCSPKVRREPTTRDATTQHFKSTVLTRRRNVRRSRIRYIATPWHPGDTTSVLRDEIRKNIRPGWRLKVFPVKEDAEGNPIPLVKRPGWAEDVAVSKATYPVG